MPQLPSDFVAASNAALQLILFVDKRAASKRQNQQVQDYLKSIEPSHSWNLQVADVEEQPYLAEYYKLVATPALIKLYPEPRQILTGANLVAQMTALWPRWQSALTTLINSQASQNGSALASPPSVKLMELVDQVFLLQQENTSLQNQIKFKDRIIAMLAHDLRNPLTAANIALETLEAQLSDLPPQRGQESNLLRKLTHHALTQTQVIERMIVNLLDSTRGNCAAIQIQPKEVDLRSLCLEVVAGLQSRFLNKQQTLATDIPSDLPPVHADRDHVRQVIINLLDNASKYTPTPGVVRLSVLHRTMQKVQVTICDNGLGIPKEKQRHIFDDEFRLDRDKDCEGYGIGLALCRRIILAHYGQIWVDSTPNQGSCFHFTLPVYRV
nr:histidine kinase [Petrachloros mirabilis]